LLDRAAGRVRVELGLVDPPLALLDGLAGRLQLGALALEALLGGGQLALGGLAAPGRGPALAALGGLAILGIALARRRRRGRRPDQPDRGGALLAAETPEADRLGDLGVGGRGLERLADPGEDLVADTVLAADRLGGAEQRVDRLLLAGRGLPELGLVGGAGQHLLLGGAEPVADPAELLHPGPRAGRRAVA